MGSTQPTIKNTRQLLGLNQTQMGVLMGMSQQAVGRIEKNYEGRTETNAHIATLRALVVLHEHGLIDELIAMWNTRAE